MSKKNKNKQSTTHELRPIESADLEPRDGSPSEPEHAAPVAEEPEAPATREEPKAESPRDELESLKERRAAKLEQRRKDAEAERVQREILELQELEAAEDEHGAENVGMVYTSLGSVILKKPSEVNYNRFQDKARPQVKDFKELLYPCRVYPSADRLDLILREQPANLGKLCTKVVELAGANREDLSGE